MSKSFFKLSPFIVVIIYSLNVSVICLWKYLRVLILFVKIDYAVLVFQCDCSKFSFITELNDFEGNYESNFYMRLLKFFKI